MKKKVQVLLSVYKPNIEYLKKQLDSINNQTYKNIEVLINDDCPTDKCDKRVFKEALKKIKYRFLPYDKQNLGYNKSFEKLVRSSDKNSYISFCDQDDIWDSDRIETLVKTLEKDNVEFVTHDRRIIDKDGKVVLKSFFATQKGIYKDWYKGHDIVQTTPFLTLVPGMSIFCTTEFAKTNLPYEPFAYDKYLSCCACFENTISKVDRPLTSYRRHGNNVSGVLAGIKDKKDYYINRVQIHNRLVNRLKNKYKNKYNMESIIAFSNARMNKNILNLYRYRKISPIQAKFEILLAITPNFLFKLFLRIKKIK
ncbi:MAG: glycosyltransferase [Romboutsia sp.]|nr:glycosyltransferase [Romboutsia sp.]